MLHHRESRIKKSHPIDFLYFADNMIVVTDCLSTEELSGEVKVVVMEDSTWCESSMQVCSLF